MARPSRTSGTLPSALRTARRRRGLSIAALALEAGVSPRLISEFEQGKRPNVSLETALRLLALVGVTVRMHDATEPDAAVARKARAARRLRRWTGSLSTLQSQVDPKAPSSSAGRIRAVFSASVLATGLARAARPPHR